MRDLTVHIPSSSKQYDILVGNHLIEHLTDHIDVTKYSKIFVITDEIIAPLFLETILKNLPEGTPSITLPSGEKAKNIVSVGQIWSAMKENNLDRKSLVINLGGGVINDMGGFAASTYMRGIAFMQIPTTLLSQIDASVGGKTGVDFAGIKNLIGSFQQPIKVIIDIQTLKTLPKREFSSGFGEMIKHGLIADKSYFEKVTSKKPEEFSENELIDLITRSCEIKKAIVESDETENGIRKLINVGHTIGHAIESLSLETDHPLLHGEAVSIGIVAETKIAQLQHMIAEEDLKTIKTVLENAGLPITTTINDKEKIITKMRADKKNVGGKINFSLLSAIGKGEINQIVPDDVTAQALDFITTS